MKIKKTYLIAGLIGVVSITAAFAYLQYRKLMDYTLNFRSIILKSLDANKITFDLYLIFNNNSTLSFNIIEQEYKIYINNVYVSTAVNRLSTPIKAKAPSPLAVNVSFNPSTALRTLGTNFAAALLRPETINIKVETKLKVYLYGVKISIPYTYVNTLKGIIDTARQKNLEQKGLS